jgi:hypothetical protein
MNLYFVFDERANPQDTGRAACLDSLLAYDDAAAMREASLRIEFDFVLFKSERLKLVYVGDRRKV